MANRELEDGDLEGFGIVFLEAGACSKAVIGGSSGGTADAIRDGETGLRIDASKESEIVSAVLELAHDPERCRRMGETGRQVVCEDYTWDTITERIQEVTQSVLDGRSPKLDKRRHREKETKEV